jgi:subtilisin-like proprotein convertase family protein
MNVPWRWQRLTCAAAAVSLLTLSGAARQTIGCTTGGPPGDLPSDAPSGGTGGGGAYPTTLPPTPMISTLAVASVPAGSTCVTEVKLFGLTHTWIGDLQWVLEDPAGVKHNLQYRALGNCDYYGDYVIVESSGTSLACNGGTTMNPGTYNQSFGAWASGTLGINNTPMTSIPPQVGNWTLYCYDWAGGDVGYMTSWDICFGTPPPPPSPVCLPSFGPGGPIPTSGTGDGTWDTTLPSAPLVVSLAVTPPAGATKIVDLRLNGWSHTWIGDLMVTLKDPAGVEHNIMCRPGLVGACCGYNCDIGGDYVFHQSTGADPSTQCTAGDYMQHFGAWTAGNLGIMNTPLESIPVLSGTYTLTIYDWAGGDTGSLSTWEFCFDATTSPPVSYCTPSGPNSDGCTTAISAPVNPNTSHTSGCVITVTDLPGTRSAILFYGINGAQAVNWCAPGQGTSQLCVVGPPWRTGIQDTGGTAGLCDGTLTLDWDAYQLGNPGAMGQPWSAGDQAWVQGWYRAPQDCRTTSLTESLELTYQ